MSTGCTGCQLVRSRVSALEAGPSMLMKWVNRLPAAFRKGAEAHLTGPAPAG